MARKKKAEDEFKDLKNVELRQIARERGIENPDRYTRPELLEALRNHAENPAEAPAENPAQPGDDDDSEKVEVFDQVDIVEEHTTQ